VELLSIGPGGYNRVVAKLIVAGAAVAAAVALLVVLWVNSVHRARITHCRNNLRHLGSIAARNWQALDPQRTGRAFWQGVRETQYRTVKGEWKPMTPDPFVCPVLGTTNSKPEDPATIDYRGPAAVPDALKDLPQGLLGADRPGNHPSGGHVLKLDLSVAETPPRVEAVGVTDSPLLRD
jgi:hypothetical protein